MKTVECDLSKFTPAMAAAIQLSREDLVKTVLSQAFVRKVQVYLTRQMDRALKDNGDIPEGQTRTVRGEVWKGWATRTRRTRYGDMLTESTRFYYRKQRRDLKPELVWSAVERAADKKRFAGTLGLGKNRKKWNETPLADRPWELVWRRRSSQSRYSASSKLMQDRGALRQSLVAMQTQIVNGLQRTIVEFRPGRLEYFDRQNALRPLFIITQADEQEIGKYFEQALADRIKRGAAA